MSRIIEDSDEEGEPITPFGSPRHHVIAISSEVPHPGSYLDIVYTSISILIFDRAS
jgi:hypothetical protein